MIQYKDFLDHILTKGQESKDRTGVGVISSFGYQMRFIVEKEFPLLTTKEVHFKSVITELLWFLKGKTNISYLLDNKVTIWNEWADENGDLGPIYGAQWRNWNFKHDQIKKLIKDLNTDPFSRRHIVSAWNVDSLEDMALPPCHLLYQLHVHSQNDLNYLSLQVYQRSADSFLGVPFNIASYAALLYLISKQVNMIPYELIWTGGNCHIYKNHLTQVKTLLQRDPKKLPTLKIINNKTHIWEYEPCDFELKDYNPHPKITAPIAV